MFFRRYDASKGGKCVARSAAGYQAVLVRGMKRERMSYSSEVAKIGTFSGATNPMK